MDNLTLEAHSSMLDSIAGIIMANGIKATSMDYIASTLHISKRTLYEIFGSKTTMVCDALEHVRLDLCQRHRQIFQSAENVLEAIWRCFMLHRDIMSRINTGFFRDMDTIFSDSQTISRKSREAFMPDMVSLLEKGVEQGYFRDDVNLPVQCRMLTIQMESLKRMEEIFPKDITLLDVYDSVTVGFLRSISSQKGAMALDELLLCGGISCQESDNFNQQ